MKQCRNALFFAEMIFEKKERNRQEKKKSQFNSFIPGPETKNKNDGCEKRIP